jgi:WD40 repeat protein
VANWNGQFLILDGHDIKRGPIHAILHDRGVNEVRWSADSTMAAVAGFDGAVHIYDSRSWTPIRKLVGHRGRLRDVAFSPDGQRLVSCGSDGLFLIWDVRSGRSLMEIRAAEPYAWYAEFSSNGTQLLTCHGDRAVHIYRVLPWTR